MGRVIILIFVIGLLAGIGGTYYVLSKEIKTLHEEANLSKVELDQYKEQKRLLDNQISASNLRESTKLTAVPQTSPKVSLIEGEDLKGPLMYKLDCISVDEKTPPSKYSWYEKMVSHLETNEKIAQYCFNKELNKTIFLSVNVQNKQKPGSQSRYQIYDIQNDKTTLEISEGNNWIYGCGSILGWSTTGNVYYTCGGGDGPWSESAVYKASITERTKGMVSQCGSFEGKEYCTKFCRSSSQCGNGSFCDLGTNSCVKSCSRLEDCAGSSCVAFGPVYGCSR